VRYAVSLGKSTESSAQSGASPSPGGQLTIGPPTTLEEDLNDSLWRRCGKAEVTFPPLAGHLGVRANAYASRCWFLNFQV